MKSNCTGIFLQVLCVLIDHPVQIVAQRFAFAEHVEQVPQVEQFNSGHKQPVVLVEKPLRLFHGEFLHW